MTIGEAVRELRRRLKLTQQQMAFKTGLAVRTISVYETGDTPGSLQVLVRFIDLARDNGFFDLLEELSPVYPFRRAEARREWDAHRDNLIKRCRAALRRLPAGNEKKRAIAAVDALVNYMLQIQVGEELYEDRRKK